MLITRCRSQKKELFDIKSTLVESFFFWEITVKNPMIGRIWCVWSAPPRQKPENGRISGNQPQRRTGSVVFWRRPSRTKGIYPSGGEFAFSVRRKGNWPVPITIKNLIKTKCFPRFPVICKIYPNGSYKYVVLLLRNYTTTRCQIFSWSASVYLRSRSQTGTNK